MAIHVSLMKKIIRANGHLVIEGTESTDELRQALVNLMSHYPINCKRPDLGIPITELITDPSWLVPAKRGRPRKVQPADITGDIL